MGNVVSIQRNEAFETIDCSACGVVFAVPGILKKTWIHQGKLASFWCPNGHQLNYGEAEVDRVRRELTAQLDAAKRDAEWLRVRNKEKERRLITAKGQMTKLRNRIGNGVCPCCHLTFKQLAAHMAQQHPAFKQPESDDAVGQSPENPT